MTSYYAVLGVGIRATPDEIRSAYRKRARLVHPDAGHPGAHDFQKLKVAYEVLRDPIRRAEHDRQLREQARQLGRVLCEACGMANRVPAIPSGFHPTCGACAARLPVDETQRRAAVRSALTHQVAGLVEDVGSEVLLMTRDAVVEGLDWLRMRIGIPKRSRRS